LGIAREIVSIQRSSEAWLRDIALQAVASGLLAFRLFFSSRASSSLNLEPQELE